MGVEVSNEEETHPAPGVDPRASADAARESDDAARKVDDDARRVDDAARHLADNERRVDAEATRKLIPLVTAWRDDTTALAHRVEVLTKSIETLATEEDINHARKRARLLLLLVVISGFFIVALGGLGLVSYQQTQARKSISYDACQQRNGIERERQVSGFAQFEVLVGAIEDPQLVEALQQYRDAAAAEPLLLPDCTLWLR